VPTPRRTSSMRVSRDGAKKVFRWSSHLDAHPAAPLVFRDAAQQPGPVLPNRCATLVLAFIPCQPNLLVRRT
jgi:hypothetical protein